MAHQGHYPRRKISHTPRAVSGCIRNRPIRLTGKEQRTIGATERLDEAKSILKEHGNYEWLTENGSFVVLNNGIEFAATYFIMLLALFFLGAGRFVSLDYWIDKKLHS